MMARYYTMIRTNYVQMEQMAGGGTFGLAGNTGTHTFQHCDRNTDVLELLDRLNAGIAEQCYIRTRSNTATVDVSIRFEGSTADIQMKQN